MMPYMRLKYALFLHEEASTGLSYLGIQAVSEVFSHSCILHSTFTSCSFHRDGGGLLSTVKRELAHISVYMMCTPSSNRVIANKVLKVS